MKKIRAFQSQKGFTLVESMVAVALLGIFAVAMTTMISQTSSQISSNISEKTEQKVVSSLIEEIRSDPNRFQKNFTPASVLDKELLTAAGSFPIAWSDHYFGDAAACTSCFGRMAYFIRPYVDASLAATSPGLYEVTIYTVDLRKAGIRDNDPEPSLASPSRSSAPAKDPHMTDMVSAASQYKFLVTVR